jgi:hypothetical protein
VEDVIVGGGVPLTLKVTVAAVRFKIGRLRLRLQLLQIQGAAGDAPAACDKQPTAA